MSLWLLNLVLFIIWYRNCESGINELKSALLLKNKVDNRLKRIANVLLLNASFIDNLGLLNGKMGIAIFFYQYAHYTGSKVFEDYASEKIDEN